MTPDADGPPPSPSQPEGEAPKDLTWDSRAARFQFVLPDKLLARLQASLEPREREHLPAASGIAEAARGHVAATFGGAPIVYHPLFDPPGSLDPGWTDEELKILGEGWTRQRVLANLEAAEPAAHHARRQGRAFAGWLVTNPQFVKEQVELLDRHASTVLEVGWPQSGRQGFFAAGGAAQQATGRVQELLHDFTAFLRRWHLAHLAAPGLPLPVDYAGIGPSMQPAHAESAVVRVEVPRVMGTLPEDELRRTVERATGRDGLGEHLRDWTKLVSPGNTNRQPLARYERWLPLTHYWRLVHADYPRACHRAKGKLQTAFGQFFGIDALTIKRDLVDIGRRLGSGWEKRPIPLT